MARNICSDHMILYLKIRSINNYEGVYQIIWRLIIFIEVANYSLISRSAKNMKQDQFDERRKYFCHFSRRRPGTVSFIFSFPKTLSTIMEIMHNLKLVTIAKESFTVFASQGI